MCPRAPAPVNQGVAIAADRRIAFQRHTGAGDRRRACRRRAGVGDLCLCKRVFHEITMSEYPEGPETRQSGARRSSRE
jgi:hypothetical protein